MLTRGAAVSDINARPLVVLQACSCRIDVYSVLDIPYREHCNQDLGQTEWFGDMKINAWVVKLT